MAAGMSHDVSDDARGEGPWRQARGEVDPEHCSAECLDLMRVSELSVLSEFALCRPREEREHVWREFETTASKTFGGATPLSK